MLVELVLAQEEINQLEQLRISQNGPLWPADPIESICVSAGF